jgi:hypothetical protein
MQENMEKKLPAVVFNNKMEFGFEGISDLCLIYNRKEKKANTAGLSVQYNIFLLILDMVFCSMHH